MTREKYEEILSGLSEITDDMHLLKVQPEIVSESPKALQLGFTHGVGQPKLQWFPKSVLGSVEHGHFGRTVGVKRWFLSRNRLWDLVS